MLCAIKIIYDLGSRDVEKDALCVVVYAFLFTIIKSTRLYRCYDMIKCNLLEHFSSEETKEILTI